MGNIRRLALSGFVLPAGGFAAAQVTQVTIDWCKVLNTVADFNLAPCGGGQDCGQFFTNVEGGTLGTANGIAVPAVSSANPVNLSEGAGNPLNWWNTTIPGVTADGTSTQNTPVDQSMFASMGTGNSDASAFQAAMLTTTVTIGAGGGTVTIGGDDDVFLAQVSSASATPGSGAAAKPRSRSPEPSTDWPPSRRPILRPPPAPGLNKKIHPALT